MRRRRCYRRAAPPALARRVLDAVLNFTSADESASFREAEQEESWRQAMSEEMKAIEDNETWELTVLLAGHRAIGLKWVYKCNEAGNIVRHKARLVVKGYVQHVGIDFDEVFAPVARLESVRMLVALVVHERWTVHHMDIKSVFLNETLKEEVYVQQPPRVRRRRQRGEGPAPPQGVVWPTAGTQGLECQV
jgi:hypothetical protein